MPEPIETTCKLAAIIGELTGANPGQGRGLARTKR